MSFRLSSTPPVGIVTTAQDPEGTRALLRSMSNLPLGVALPYRFSRQEPAINRYSAGGFTLSRTGINMRWQRMCSLAPTTHFRAVAQPFGGRREDDVACEPTFNLRPAVGVGVVFGGTVKQAGLAVRSGVRHVLVASFNIADKRIYGWCGSSLIMERVRCCIQ